MKLRQPTLTRDRGSSVMSMNKKRKMLAEQLEDRRLLAGPYAPAAGQLGSTAIANDDAAIVSWATGYENYQPGSNVDLAFQVPYKAIGQAEGTTSDAVTLGRHGQITLSFASPIRDGFGSDFAVFENSFSDTFLELAYVEVSSDGTNFFRFENDSLTSAPVGAFGEVDPTNVHNLAGKYRRGQGTPFDLEDLRDVSPLLNTAAVTHVRVIDVVGDGSALDTSGDVIYDPSPTLGSAGFDLDGVGVLNELDYASDLVGFEDLGTALDPESFFNGPDPDGTVVTGPYDDVVVLGEFTSELLTFNNAYSTDFDSWNQWAYSNMTDTVTAGYLNQFSAYPGDGADDSATFGVAFASQGDFYDAPLITRDDADLRTFGSLEVTNTTYAALSMLLGDSFAKKFGGDSGNDPDYFTLTIEGLDASGQPVGTVDVFLADYRFSDNALDYILDEWVTVDLGPVANARSLSFSVNSSDVGVFGMNTPSYFAVDDIVMLTPVVAFDLQSDSVEEGDGENATMARLSRAGGDLSEAIEFTLDPVDASQAILPTSVTIPVGATHIDFPIGVVDNSSADGDRDIVIRVTADGYAGTERILQIRDNDPFRLSLDLSASEIAEGGVITGTLVRNDAAPEEALTIQLSASIDGRLDFDSSIVIPAGQNNASFEIAAPEDDVDHRDVTMFITAQASGYEDGTDTLFVLDNDTPKLDFTFTGSPFSEQDAKPTEDFELLGRRLAPESAYNGADGAGQFVAGGLNFNNDYNPTYGSWAGWAYSNSTDVTTSGYLNQYSSFTGGGAINSDTFLVGNAYPGSVVPTITRDTASTGAFSTLDITNVTYAALSMQEGDFFAKKFGGVSGNDPDFFILTIEGLDVSGVSIGTVDFPLADFRFDEQSSDYILDAWTSVDLSAIGDATTLTFSLLSSDIGQYGMNTPAYFALDNVKFDEGGEQPTLTVTRNAPDQTEELVVQLYTSDHSEAVIQSSVVVPAGQAAVDVTWEIIDDSVFDGQRPVAFTALAEGYEFAQQTILVEDNDSAVLTLTLSAVEMDETAGSLGGLVHRNSGDLSFPLVVSLESDLAGVLDFPSSVTIPAGQRSQTFDVTVVDNEYRDGDRIVQVLSTAESHVVSTAFVQVVDDEISAVVVSPTDGSTVVSEMLGADEFSVTLASRPQTDVLINLDFLDWPAGPVDVTLDQSQLVFTSDDWNVPRTVSVIGIPDLLAEGDEEGSVRLKVDGVNSDALFSAAPENLLSVVVRDWQPSTLTVSEDASQVFLADNTSGVKLLTGSHEGGLNVVANDLPQTIVIEPLSATTGTVQIDFQGGADVVELNGDYFTRLDGGSGIDRFVVKTATTLELLGYINGRVFGFEEYVLESQGDSKIEVDLNSLGDFSGSDETGDLTVYVQSGDQFKVLGDANYASPEMVGDQFAQVITSNEGTLQVVSERPWQNVVLRGDANHSGDISVADALAILNHLSAFGSDLPAEPVLADFRGVFPDVSGDSLATAFDALLVLNGLALVSDAEGEGRDFPMLVEPVGAFEANEFSELRLRENDTSTTRLPVKLVSVFHPTDHAILDMYSAPDSSDGVKIEDKDEPFWEILGSNWT